MSDISLPGGRAGLPVFDFVANEGPPPLLKRIAACFARSGPAESPARPSPPPDVEAVRSVCRSTRPARIRVAWRALRVFGAMLRRLCVFVAPRIWRVYRRWPATALGATGACALLGFALLSIPDADRTPGATGRPARTAESRGWIQIVRPAQVYSLESRDLGDAGPRYEASRYGVGIGRKDILTFGAFGGADHPWLRLRLYRQGPEPRPDESVETSLAGLLHGEHLDLVSAEPLDDVPTRFGKMSTLRATVSAHGDDAGPLECLGFHIAAAGPALVIEGLACESPERLIRTTALGCLLDRLDLLAGASDDDLRLFFARVEPMRRRECGRPGAARSPERERPAQDRAARNGPSVSRT